MYSGNSLLKFCDNIVAPSSRVKKSKKKVSIPPKREMRNWRERQYHRDVMHSRLPAAEKEQISDGLDLGYQLMRLAMG